MLNPIRDHIPLSLSHTCTQKERSGRPAMSRTEGNIAEVRQIMRENHRLIVRSIAEQANIDRETVRKILTEDLDMRKVCAEMIPKELTEEQTQRRVEICQDLLERLPEKLGGNDRNFFFPQLKGSCIRTMQLLTWHSL
jgi:hypothetical protein